LKCLGTSLRSALGKNQGLNTEIAMTSRSKRGEWYFN
jgi:hypothetical protein